MTHFTIAPDDPEAADVRRLLGMHLKFAHSTSPPEAVYALDATGLGAPDISFFAARGDGGELLGVGALRQLDATHAEIKSMHTASAARGRGIGRAMLAHLMTVARSRGCTRVSLETGTMEEFAPARTLYASAGFVPCEPFGDYAASLYSVCMTRELD